MGIISFILIGAAAGWLADGKGSGLRDDIIVGVIGAFIGAYLLWASGADLGSGLGGSLFAAAIGALVLLFVVPFFTRPRSEQRLGRHEGSEQAAPR